MTRDDVIKMLRESGFLILNDDNPDSNYMIRCYEDFANLVAATERKVCAQICENNREVWPDAEWEMACLVCAEEIRTR
jgi:hypothetical protein